MVRVGGDTSDGVGFFGVCIVCLAVFLNRFDSRGGGLECVLVCSPSEVGMVTHSECFFSVWSDGGVFPLGIMPGVFYRMKCWCVCGAIRI